MLKGKDSELLELEEEDFDTILASDISFAGTIRFSKPFMIRGTVTGLIEATSDLVIDTDAATFADIHAERVLVRGKVEGNIKAKRLVFVASTGLVTGDIFAEQVVLEPGSTFTGRCVMTNKT